MARPTLSLRFRIAVTIFCLEAVMVGLVLFVTLRHSLDTAQAQLTAADRETMALLHDSARVALLTDEFANVQAFIGNVGSGSRIRFVAVIDLSGRIMASSDAAQIGTRSADRARWGAWPNELMEIGSGRYRLGWLAVRFSDESLLQANRTAYRLGIGVAVAGMLVIALVGATMGHLLTRRLGRLAAVADQVSEGNLAVRASIEGNDEVARVGRAFDGMVDRLQQRLETIRLDRERLILPTEAIHEGFALWDTDDRLVLCNRRFRELLGVVGARVEFGTSYEAFVRAAAAEVIDVAPSDLEAAVRAQVELHRAGGLPREFGLRDGRWIQVSKSPMPDGNVVGIYTDITEAKHREFALRDSERRLRAIMDSVGEGIVVLDASGRVEAMNPAAAAIFGRAPGDGEAMPHVDELLEPTGPVAPPPVPRPAAGRAAPAPTVSAEMVGIRADGRRFPAEVSMAVLRRSPQDGRIATVRDVTVQKANRDLIVRQATHDALTGLPNRRLFHDRLEMTLRQARRSGELVGVAFLDVDRFKTINDSLGHALGDRLLVTLAQRLRAALRDSDTIARMGGDEFIFILPGLRRAADAARPAEKLLDAIRSPPVRIEEQELFLTASVGVSVYPADGHEHDTLLRHADTALYRAKARGRNRFELFDRSMTVQAAAKVTLEADLRRACDQDELTLVYQPQLNFRSGEVLGFEALMRWRHPQRGLIPPDTFIPLAEESGLISALGIWALRQACRDLIAWEHRFGEPLRIAVNVSPRQLQHDDLVEQVARVLRETGLAAQRLELELTETALLHDDETTGQAISRLRALGVGLALDDFGTGYSSLSHLRRYPIQRLKMDRSFVRGVTSDRGDAAVARAIIALARELDLAVVAEGVETAEQLELLRAFGCEEGQGYYLGRPASAAAVGDLLRRAA